MGGRRRPGILASIDDDTIFSTVEVDRVEGTVRRPNGIDPDVLRGEQSATTAGRGRLVREFRLQSAG